MALGDKMREPKKEINLLDQELLCGILKKRNTAHVIAEVSKVASIIGLSLTTVGLFAKEPISSIIGFSFAAISTIAKVLASKKEDKCIDEIKQLCGNQYIVVGKGKNSEVINLDDEEAEQEEGI